MKVNEAWFAIGSEHYVARLEIAIHECARLATHQHLSHRLKVVFESVFLKLQSCGLQETILEVVEIPHYRPDIEFLGGIAFREVQPYSSEKLYVGQRTYRAHQQFTLVCAERSGFASCLYRVEQYGVAEVFLKIYHTVSAYCHDMRHRQAFRREVLVEIDECFIFFN